MNRDGSVLSTATFTRALSSRLLPAHALITFAMALALSCALLCSTRAHAADDCRSEVPSARLSGAGEFHLFGFHLYDAQLWSARLPVSYDARFALLLTYTRAVSRERLTKLGLDEMQRLATTPLSADRLAQWREDMLKSFVDIEPGDQLCGVFLPGKGVRFFANGQPTATIDDPDFARAFFGIWLDPDTRATKLRTKLLGG